MDNWPQVVAERVVGNPLGAQLGMELVEAELDRVVFKLPFRHQNTTMGDQLHGGAIAALIDSAATAVAWSGTDASNPPSRGTTVNLEVSYTAPARATDLVATATVPRRGRSICFCHVDVHDVDGSLVAQGDAIYKLSQQR